MRRSIQQIQQVVLLSQKLVNLLLQGRQVKFVFRIQHLVGRKVAAHILAQHLIRAPIPIGAQHSFADVGIVPDSMVDSTGAAGRSHSRNIALRTRAAKGSSQHAVQIFRQAADRCIGNHFVSRQTAENLLHSRQADELLVLVQNSADSRIRHVILAIFCRSSNRRRISTKNFVLSRFSLRVFCSNTSHVYILLSNII